MFCIFHINSLLPFQQYWPFTWAENAKAATGRRCPHSGVGEDFFARRLFFLTKRAVSRKRKVAQWIRRCEIDRLAKGYKVAIVDIRGPIAKKHVLATTRQSVAKKNVPFSQINISLYFFIYVGCFFLENRWIFCPFFAFRQNVKTTVSP